MKKITLGLCAFLLAFGFASTAITAHAAPASLSILYTADQKMGSSGPSATELQAFLGEQGYFNLPSGANLGYFGSVTKAALIKYQAAMGLPATGYFGPMTKNTIQNYMMMHCWLGACNTM